MWALCALNASPPPFRRGVSPLFALRLWFLFYSSRAVALPVSSAALNVSEPEGLV